MLLIKDGFGHCRTLLATWSWLNRLCRLTKCVFMWCCCWPSLDDCWVRLWLVTWLTCLWRTMSRNPSTETRRWWWWQINKGHNSYSCACEFASVHVHACGRNLVGRGWIGRALVLVKNRLSIVLQASKHHHQQQEQHPPFSPLPTPAMCTVTDCMCRVCYSGNAIHGLWRWRCFSPHQSTTWRALRHFPLSSEASGAALPSRLADSFHSPTFYFTLLPSSSSLAHSHLHYQPPPFHRHDQGIKKVYRNVYNFRTFRNGWVWRISERKKK